MSLAERIRKLNLGRQNNRVLLQPRTVLRVAPAVAKAEQAKLRRGRRGRVSSMSTVIRLMCLRSRN